MEKNAQIKDIDLLEASLNNRPCDKHDEDHVALRSSLRILLVIVKKLEEMICNTESVRTDEWESLADLNGKVIENYNNTIKLNNNVKKLGSLIEEMQKNYPTISTMQKSALIMNGENVIDTVKIESWRYLMVKSISPSDWNEYAKLDKTFSWEIVEVTNWEYDVKIDLDTNTEWETATMTVNVDLLFIKY